MKVSKAGFLGQWIKSTAICIQRWFKFVYNNV